MEEAIIYEITKLVIALIVGIPIIAIMAKCGIMDKMCEIADKIILKIKGK